jgi:hypothetical protein
MKNNDLSTEAMAHCLGDFGDYNVFKDSSSSFFLEFYFIEPTAVPTPTVDAVLQALRTGDAAAQRGILTAVAYSEATKFKAHNRLE